MDDHTRELLGACCKEHDIGGKEGAATLAVCAQLEEKFRDLHILIKTEAEIVPPKGMTKPAPGLVTSAAIGMALSDARISCACNNIDGQPCWLSLRKTEALVVALDPSHFFKRGGNSCAPATKSSAGSMVFTAPIANDDVMPAYLFCPAHGDLLLEARNLGIFHRHHQGETKSPASAPAAGSVGLLRAPLELAQEATGALDPSARFGAKFSGVGGAESLIVVERVSSKDLCSILDEIRYFQGELTVQNAHVAPLLEDILLANFIANINYDSQEEAAADVEAAKAKDIIRRRKTVIAAQLTQKTTAQLDASSLDHRESKEDHAKAAAKRNAEVPTRIGAPEGALKRRWSDPAPPAASPIQRQSGTRTDADSTTFVERVKSKIVRRKTKSWMGPKRAKASRNTSRRESRSTSGRLGSFKVMKNIRGRLSKMASPFRRTSQQLVLMADRAKRPTEMVRERRKAATAMQIMNSIMEKGKLPMVVVEYAALVAAGKLPRSDDNATRTPYASDVIVFVSHRWWGGNEPDINGIKYGLLIRGLQALAATEGYDLNNVVLWIDYACIDQDDHERMALGIESLIAYAACCTAMLVPVFPDRAAATRFYYSSHPSELLNYGERAWCRLETYVALCLTEVRGKTLPLFGYGICKSFRVASRARPLSKRLQHTGMGRRFGCFGTYSMERLKRLGEARDLQGIGAAFTNENLPSKGNLTNEDDRQMVKKVEDEVRDVYVTFAIRFELRRLMKECEYLRQEIAHRGNGGARGLLMKPLHQLSSRFMNSVGSNITKVGSTLKRKMSGKGNDASEFESAVESGFDASEYGSSIGSQLGSAHIGSTIGTTTGSNIGGLMTGGSLVVSELEAKAESTVDLASAQSTPHETPCTSPAATAGRVNKLGPTTSPGKSNRALVARKNGAPKWLDKGLSINLNAKQLRGEDVHLFTDMFTSAAKAEATELLQPDTGTPIQLRIISFADNRISREGIYQLFTGFLATPVCRNLRTLDLSGNKLGKDGARAIGEVLKTEQTRLRIRELNLARNGFGKKGAKAICDWLPKLDKLKALGTSCRARFFCLSVDSFEDGSALLNLCD